MKQATLGFAFLVASAGVLAGADAEYTREGCWYYCDEGVVVTVMEDIVLFSSPPWHKQKQTAVGAVKSAEKVLVVKAETKGTAARLRVKEAKHGFALTDDVLVFAYTGEGTYAIKQNGETREFVELGFGGDPCREGAWCEMIGKPSQAIWSYVETSTKVRGWTNSNKLLSPKW